MDKEVIEEKTENEPTNEKQPKPKKINKKRLFFRCLFILMLIGLIAYMAVFSQGFSQEHIRLFLTLCWELVLPQLLTFKRR